MGITNQPLGKNKLDSYILHGIDDNGTTEYDGFALDDGTWLIKRSIVSGNETTFLYANQSNNSGTTTYSSAWTNRATLNYDAIFALSGV